MSDPQVTLSSARDNPSASAKNISRKAPLPGQDAGIAALAGFGIFLLLLALHPVIGGPVNDDFSYAHTAEALARTGQYAYNAWGTPLILPQAAMGAVIIRCAGFQYAALEWLGIVCAALATGVLYLTGRACGLKTGWSLLVTAAVTGNVIFLTNAPTFMTDVPTLLMLLLAFGALIRSLRTTDRGDPESFVSGVDIRWLALATVLGITAGANRQICWVAFLGALIPPLLMLKRRDERIPLLFAGLLTLASASWGSLWFEKQPYSLPSDLLPGVQTMLAAPSLAAVFIYRFLNMFSVTTLPLAILAATQIFCRRRVRWLLFGALLVISILPMALTLGMRNMDLLAERYALTPYGQAFTHVGVLIGGVTGFELRPAIMPPALIAILVFAGAVAIALGGYVMLTYGEILGEVRRMRPTWRRSEIAVASGCVMSVAQVLVSLPWYTRMFMFDRYYLLLMPGILFLYAFIAQRGAENRSMAAQDIPVETPAISGAIFVSRLLSGLCLLFFAVWGIGTSLEYFNYGRARMTLYNELAAHGVPRTAIDGGFELSADTQVTLAGHINNEQVTNPRDTFRPLERPTYVSYEDKKFSVMDARYRISTETTPDPALVWPDPIRTLTYTSPIFAPHDRQMFVYKIRRPDEDTPPVGTSGIAPPDSPILR